MNKQENVPALRFPEFMGNWVVKRFDEIFFFSTGKNIKQNEASPEFETPCVRYGELYHMYNEVIYKVINKTSLNKSELLFSDGNEILLPSAGEDPLDIGSASALTIKNVAIGRTINILKPQKPDIYSQIYVSYYINQKLRKTIATLAKGVSISNVYNSDLKTLEIILPSLPEQQKIATFLSSVDEKLQGLKKKKSLLEAYKKGMMQRLFSSEPGLTRLEDEQNLDDNNPTILTSRKLRFRQDNGEDFPDWEEKTLGEVSIRKTLKNKEGNTNVLTISAQFGLISQLEFFNKSVSAKDISGYYLIEKGDFAYNKSYSNGYPMGAIKCLKRYDKGVVSTLYICFKFNNGISNSFMEHYFEIGLHNKEIEKVAQEGARNHGLLNIGLNDFFSIVLKLPTLPEQTKIANFLSAIDEKIAKVSQEIEQATVWKKGLLQQMFV